MFGNNVTIGLMAVTVVFSQAHAEFGDGANPVRHSYCIMKHL